MKNLIYFPFIVLLFGVMLNVSPVFSQDEEPLQEVVTTEFKVLGLCGMCKNRIEKAAFSVRGVRSANWVQEKQMLEVSYRTKRTDQQSIERAVAKAGHDTQNFITSPEIHANLHHCCKYPRDPEMVENNKLYNQD